ncbi:copper resistance protein [Aliivibrio fischeri]|uniref:copper resistance protein n=1 Tax=Aliivibrio fischeri TaxID=668 RepID=UPI00084C52A3|nr:copper resistance protein [Aliivibrio fischeri]OED54084.1 copper resistance protein [Aliivibrio fischeri]
MSTLISNRNKQFRAKLLLCLVLLSVFICFSQLIGVTSSCKDHLIEAQTKVHQLEAVTGSDSQQIAPKCELVEHLLSFENSMHDLLLGAWLFIAIALVVIPLLHSPPIFIESIERQVQKVRRRHLRFCVFLE